ncbi:hypothetical protein DFS34DRAFT_650063 [Phlyctochytrium arcticum]|nr:hypothetical protein DFS34DRAFT_650063 [Phlyctochytrium arcticum]
MARSKGIPISQCLFALHVVVCVLSLEASAQVNTPQLPPQAPPTIKEKFLDTDDLFYSLVPELPSDDFFAEYPPDDCFANWCFPAGMFVDLAVKHCNSTLTKLTSQTLPSTPAEVDRLFGECLCGSDNDKDMQQNIMSMWKTCITCLNGKTGVRDPKHASAIEASRWTRACSCKKPGVMEAMLNLGNPGWNCTEYDEDRLRAGMRSGRAVMRPPCWWQ